MTREIVILNINPELCENIKTNLIDNLKEFGNITIFKYKSIADTDYSGYKVIELPDNIDTEPKARNFINKFFKDASYNNFLHVILDTTVIKTNPSIFIDDIESMMTFFDYNVWFSTITDQCNYLYNKYIPRVSIKLDRPEYYECKSKIINFTSHSNTNWIIYDMSKQLDDLLYFDEQYTIAMYWIIEFLARRRNTKSANKLYYMNQYMTVESEISTFDKIIVDDNIDLNIQKIENTTFKEHNINFSPDNNIDDLLINFWNVAKDKIK